MQSCRQLQGHRYFTFSQGWPSLAITFTDPIMQWYTYIALFNLIELFKCKLDNCMWDFMIVMRWICISLSLFCNCYEICGKLAAVQKICKYASDPALLYLMYFCPWIFISLKFVKHLNPLLLSFHWHRLIE